MADSQPGYLVLADISGYTAFLSESELEHARDTLTDLLGLLIDHTKPPLVLSKLEGDAVFSYTWGAESFRHGQTFVELIENAYVAFRRAIELMVMNNTCRCAACANVSKLDLKFVVHHGTFARQELGGQVELVGTDVILAHRLMKNTVAEQTGITAYMLYTHAAIQQLGLEATTGTMAPHVERYDHLEDVRLWVEDMHPVWEQRRHEHAVEFEPLVTAHVDIALPPEVLWGYLSQPSYRAVIIGADRVTLEDRRAGRMAPGSRFQCFHGKHTQRQVIAEWTPFERMVSQDTDTMPLLDSLTWRNEYRLVATETGTHLTISLGGFEGPWLRRKVATMALSRGVKQFEGNLHEFAAMAVADWAKQQAAARDSSAVELTEPLIREAASAALHIT
jgi:hypothetical protein